MRSLFFEYDLPIRMASQEVMTQFGFPDARAALEADGIVMPDVLVFGRRRHHPDRLQRTPRSAARGIKQTTLPDSIQNRVKRLTQ